MKAGKFITCLNISLIILFSSCVSKKTIVYFQNDEIDQSKVSNNYTTIFKPDDLLQIIVSARNIESAIPFNLPAVTFDASNGRAVGQPVQQNYLVDSKGYIDFPVLGMLKIGGLTREETIDMFKKKLDPDYIKTVSYTHLTLPTTSRV